MSGKQNVEERVDSMNLKLVNLQKVIERREKTSKDGGDLVKRVEKMDENLKTVQV